jgi:hypothetical protein
MGCSDSKEAILINESLFSSNTDTKNASTYLDEWGTNLKINKNSNDTTQQPSTIKIVSAPYDIRVKSSRADKTILYNYRRKSLFGKGGFATIYVYTNSSTKQDVILKIIPKGGHRKYKLMAENEIEIHRTLDHEHIVKYQESFEDARNVYMVSKE